MFSNKKKCNVPVQIIGKKIILPGHDSDEESLI